MKEYSCPLSRYILANPARFETLESADIFNCSKNIYEIVDAINNCDNDEIVSRFLDLNWDDFITNGIVDEIASCVIKDPIGFTTIQLYAIYFKGQHFSSISALGNDVDMISINETLFKNPNIEIVIESFKKYCLDIFRVYGKFSFEECMNGGSKIEFQISI